MIRLFLKAKHWQLFLLIYLLPFIIYMSTLILTFMSFSNRNDQSFSWVKSYMPFVVLVMLISTVMYFGWLWSVANGLQHKIPYEIKMKLKKFKYIFFFPFIYLTYIASVLVLPLIIKSLGAYFVYILFGLQFLSVACIFYCYYFVAKTIRTAEVKFPLTFSQFANEFFLILFFPIGVWWLQPRINKLINEEEVLEDPLEPIEPLPTI